jgi:hypothetical protein
MNGLNPAQQYGPDLLSQLNAAAKPTTTAPTAKTSSTREKDIFPSFFNSVERQLFAGTLAYGYVFEYEYCKDCMASDAL